MNGKELATRLRLIDNTLSGLKIEATDTNLDRLLGAKQELKRLAQEAEQDSEAGDADG